MWLASCLVLVPYQPINSTICTSVFNQRFASDISPISFQVLFVIQNKNGFKIKDLQVTSVLFLYLPFRRFTQMKSPFASPDSFWVYSHHAAYCRIILYVLVYYDYWLYFILCTIVYYHLLSYSSYIVFYSLPMTLSLYWTNLAVTKLNVSHISWATPPLGTGHSRLAPIALGFAQGGRPPHSFAIFLVSLYCVCVFTKPEFIWNKYLYIYFRIYYSAQSHHPVTVAYW